MTENLLFVLKLLDDLIHLVLNHKGDINPLVMN